MPSGQSYQWDANGNLLDDSERSYRYDSVGQLVEVVEGEDSYTFAYNGLGARLQQGHNGATTTYLLDLNRDLPQVLGDGTHRYLYRLARIAAQATATGAWRYHHGDALRSPRLMVDNAGAAVSARHFDPWGQPTASTQPGRFGFTGEPQDTAMGLVHLRARWYQPGTGRFLSVDPFAGMARRPYSQHPYQYGYSNPLRYTDPSGQAAGAGNITVVCAALIAGDLVAIVGDLACVALVTTSLYASYTIATHTGVLDGGGNHTTCDPCQIELDPEQDVFPEVFPPPQPQSLEDIIIDTPLDPPPSPGDIIHDTPLVPPSLPGDNIHDTPLDPPPSLEDLITGFPLPDIQGIDICAASQSQSNRVYVPTKKHKKHVGWGTIMDLDDATAQRVLEEAIQHGKQVYGYYEGKVYEFQPDKHYRPDGKHGYHGYPVKGDNVPSKVRRELLDRGIITKREYNRMVKGKE